jgi:hypothetical protein
LCRHGPEVDPKSEPEKLLAAIFEEFPAEDEMSRQMAIRLAELAGGSGAAAVQAVRALGELVAWQRGDPR